MTKPKSELYTSFRRELLDKVLDDLYAQHITDVLDRDHFFRAVFRDIDEETEVPCVKAAILSGKSDYFSNRPEFQHDDILTVAYIASGNDELEDKLYHFEEKIRKFLVAQNNKTKGWGMVNTFDPSGMSIQQLQGATGIGAVVITFGVNYMVDYSTAFDDLARIHVEIKPTTAPEGDDPLFEETITLPTA